MKIEVLGAGCAKCRALTERAREAARAIGIDYELVHITDLDELVRRAIPMTPALMVDGILRLTGRSASVGELKRLLRETARTAVNA